MRILLQSFETGLYLDTSGDWTNTSALAQNFRDTRQAAEFKLHRRLPSAFVVVQPEHAPTADLIGPRDAAMMHAQEPAQPAGCRVKAAQAKMMKEGHSAEEKSTMTKRPKGSDRHPSNVKV